MVALVTGSTWGLGLAIVQALCQGFKWDVYLSAWDVQRGAVVVEDLQREGLKPRLLQLDITDLANILAAWQHFMKEYGGMDVLINNTRIAPRSNCDPASFGSQLLPLHDLHIPPLRRSGSALSVLQSLSVNQLSLGFPPSCV
uniref:Carbonyl reductase 1 n=1 Tax=Oncorhynchus kisutch TaxID=8019 RepID=A0A8C7FSX0_ONCKI